MPRPLSGRPQRDSPPVPVAQRLLGNAKEIGILVDDDERRVRHQRVAVMVCSSWVGWVDGCGSSRRELADAEEPWMTTAWLCSLFMGFLRARLSHHSGHSTVDVEDLSVDKTGRRG